MKQLVLTVAIALVASVGFTQKNNVTNAVLAYKDFSESRAEGDLDQAAKNILEAKKYIDLASEHPDTKGQAKTLVYKGKIYFDISVMSEASQNEMLKEIDAGETAKMGLEALKESKKVDKKGRYEDDVALYANQYRIDLSQAGIDAYTAENYEVAMGALIGAAEFGNVLGVQDSSFLLYGAISAHNVGQYDVSRETFQKCIDLDYETALSAKYISRAYQEEGNLAEAETFLKDISAKKPNNKDVLIELINLYIDTERNEEAEKVLTSAIELDPKNTALIYTSGNIYETMDRIDDAVSAYERTLEIDGNHTSAQFSLGGVYFNKGADKNNEANKLPFGDANYDAMVAESKGYFEKALPYLESAAKSEPEDIVILESLKAVYGKLGNLDKLRETKAMIEKVKAGE